VQEPTPSNLIHRYQREGKPRSIEPSMPLAGTQHNLKRHLQTLAGDIGERNVYHPHALMEAEHYIRHEWQQQGYDVVAQRYEAKGMDCANLEVTRIGTDTEAPLILIGAHYDTVKGSPGANDNGSGLAAMLELTRLFTTLTPATTIRFVAFVNEESPFFYWGKMGSMVYAKMAQQRKDNIQFMASLETIGYYRHEPHSQAYPPLLKWFYTDRADFIAFVSNFKSRRTMQQAVKAFQNCSDFPLQHIATFAWVPGVSWSDHMAFWRHGYKAFMVTDTAFYRYPYYHTPQDTPDKVQIEPLAKLTQSLFCCLSTMAQAS
jgi:Zn-dependent M28 family amino/carboxypeptidase